MSRIVPQRRRSRRIVPALVAWLAAGCAGGPASSGLDAPPPPVPDLGGVGVMVFPVQSVQGLPAAGVEAELAWALAARAPHVDWVPPAELRAVIDRSAGVPLEVENLPVGVFLRGEVRRLGDPVFGVLRRMASVTDARVALLPVALWYETPEGAADAPGHARLAVALVDALDGRVVWFGVERGDEGAAEDAAVVASVLDRLAARLAGPR